jgi:DNA-binding transcriptional ArsR family regulator
MENRIFRLTGNRKLILSVLADHIDSDPPPHSASSILYALENAFKYGWDGYDIKAIPSKEQLYRTLRDLLEAGLVVSEKQKDEPLDNGLPYWCNYYQLAGEVEKNAITAECNEVYQKVRKAKYGSSLFGSVFDRGIPADEVKPLMARVKILMQRTHPDKSGGLEFEFKQMQECSKIIRSGLPLPMPPHEAGGNITLKLTKS